MLIFPAIDLIRGQAVRLYRGDYEKMTVYSPDPVAVAADFRRAGATCIHLVDLEGARDGGTPNFQTITAIKASSGLFCEVGGGIRDMDTVRRYMDAGIDRVILGTAALTDPEFLQKAVSAYGPRIAVGADIRDGMIAVRGWTEISSTAVDDFFARLTTLGVDNVICTDISRDGAMQGTNRDLYRRLSRDFPVKITASGGVSDPEDVAALREMGLYGAIIGKAYYEKTIDLSKAIEVAK